MLKTFLDAGVLIAAARGSETDRQRGLSILEDPARAFFATAFLYLELLPKAVFNQRHLEKVFYEKYFREAQWMQNFDEIVALARLEAERAGLGAMDALHLAAAHLAGAAEFITTEKPTAPMYRSALVKIVYFYK